MDNVKPAEMRRARSLLWAALAAVLFVGGVQATAFLVVRKFLSDWSHRGQFGDIFGVTNSLFSGLAFAALLYTILLQQRQIDLQREDLTDQRNASRRAHDLSALTVLLEHYTRRKAQLDQYGKQGKGPANLDAQLVATTRKIGEVTKILDNLHVEVVSRQEHS